MIRIFLLLFGDVNLNSGHNLQGSSLTLINTFRMFREFLSDNVSKCHKHHRRKCSTNLQFSRRMS